MKKYLTLKEAKETGKDWYGMMPITEKGRQELFTEQNKAFLNIDKLDLEWLKEWASETSKNK